MSRPVIVPLAIALVFMAVQGAAAVSNPAPDVPAFATYLGCVQDCMTDSYHLQQDADEPVVGTPSVWLVVCLWEGYGVPSVMVGEEPLCPPGGQHVAEWGPAFVAKERNVFAPGSNGPGGDFRLTTGLCGFVVRVNAPGGPSEETLLAPCATIQISPLDFGSLPGALIDEAYSSLPFWGNGG